MRKVGGESQKTYEEKLSNGFFERFCKGNGLDIGGRGYIEAESILPTATMVDLDYPSYDGKILPFLDKSQDYVYSSHCLEHISNYQQAIQEWYRVTKVGGYIVTVVPHRDLYEKQLNLPSRWNEDHKRYYTPASLLKEFEDSLRLNSFRVRHLQDNDKGHDYSLTVDIHSPGQYEIELVIEKIT